MVINRQMYTSVEFFQEKDRTFLTWIAVVLRPMKFEFKEYIYKESELAQESIFHDSPSFSIFHLKGPGRLRDPSVCHQDLPSHRIGEIFRPLGAL